MTRASSFRWGIPELDDEGGLYVYGFMLRNYAAAGVTRDEFMAIVHLASYHYETSHSKGASPSAHTLAQLMGYQHPNSVYRLLDSLIEKGLAEKEERPGLTPIYVMRKFAKRMLELDTLTSQCDGTQTPQCETPQHPSVTEEKETKKKKPKEKEITTPAASAAAPSVAFQPLIDAYLSCLSTAERAFWTARPVKRDGKPGASQYGRLVQHAQFSASLGIDAGEIGPAYRDLKAEKFWQGKILPLDKVGERVIAMRATSEREQAKAADTSRYAAVAAPAAAIDDAIAQAHARRDAPAVVPGSAEDVWARALDTLRQTSTRATFDAYLSGTSGVERHNGTLTVRVKDELAAEWLSTIYRPRVAQAVIAAAGAPVEVQYVTKGQTT